LPKRFQTERPVLSPTEVETLAQAIPHESDRVLVRLMAFGLVANQRMLRATVARC
jgi:hypothetical protein